LLQSIDVTSPGLQVIVGGVFAQPVSAQAHEPSSWHLHILQASIV
jgi:hypothetical protein